METTCSNRSIRDPILSTRTKKTKACSHNSGSILIRLSMEELDERWTPCRVWHTKVTMDPFVPSVLCWHHAISNGALPISLKEFKMKCILIIAQASFATQWKSSNFRQLFQRRRVFSFVSFHSCGQSHSSSFQMHSMWWDIKLLVYLFRFLNKLLTKQRMAASLLCIALNQIQWNKNRYEPNHGPNMSHKNRLVLRTLNYAEKNQRYVDNSIEQLASHGAPHFGAKNHTSSGLRRAFIVTVYHVHR